jgi:hypothetical protein
MSMHVGPWSILSTLSAHTKLRLVTSASGGGGVWMYAVTPSNFMLHITLAAS